MTVLVKNPPGLFIHIPKTGGVSVSRWLTLNLRGSYFLDKHWGGKHADQKMIDKHLKRQNINPEFTFVIVRNPWDRLVSAYHYYKKRKKIDISFEDYVRGKWGKTKPWGCAEKQMHQYFDNVDLIIRFENLNEEFKAVQQHFKCHLELPKANDSKHKHYTEYYTDELKDIVYKKHAKDIKKFKYEFES